MVIREKIKNIEIIRMLYEMPYKICMYCVAKRVYHEYLKAMTDDDIQRVRKYKDIHKGGRCFIVLTGPSLRAEDLGMIKDEICITVNSGYKAYGTNGWKPWYYVSVDGGEVAQEMLKEVLEGDYDYKGVFTSKGNPFVNDRLIKLPSDGSLIFRLDSILHSIFPNLFTAGKISTDIARRIYDGKTVLHAALQIAVYMGFDEIYLLGADFNYQSGSTHSRMTSEVIKAKNVNWDRKERDMMSQTIDFAADAKKKGIKIFNATRGGRLECFQRVDLDKLFETDER